MTALVAPGQAAAA